MAGGGGDDSQVAKCRAGDIGWQGGRFSLADFCESMRDRGELCRPRNMSGAGRAKIIAGVKGAASGKPGPDSREGGGGVKGEPKARSEA